MMCCVKSPGILFVLCPIRFLLKKTKPEFNTSQSSARLPEEVIADEREGSGYVMQTSTVRLSLLSDPTCLWALYYSSNPSKSSQPSSMCL